MNKLLHQTRVCSYSENIKPCGHDQKSIYKLSKHLVGNGEGQPLPSGLPVKELTMCFSDYKKVDNTRSDLQTRQLQMYDNASYVATAMSDFEPATPEEVHSFIRKDPDKSCELDPIPTWLLK